MFHGWWVLFFFWVLSALVVMGTLSLWKASCAVAGCIQGCTDLQETQLQEACRDALTLGKASCGDGLPLWRASCTMAGCIQGCIDS